jgi:hypothetical protein
MLPPSVISGAAARASCGNERESDAVNQEVEPSEFLSDFAKRLIDLVLFRHVTREQQRTGHGVGSQTLDVLFQTIALISKGQFGAGLVQSLGGGPGNRALVGYAKNDSVFVLQHEMCGGSLTLPHFQVKS